MVTNCTVETVIAIWGQSTVTSGTSTENTQINEQPQAAESCHYTQPSILSAQLCIIAVNAHSLSVGLRKICDKSGFMRTIWIKTTKLVVSITIESEIKSVLVLITCERYIFVNEDSFRVRCRSSSYLNTISQMTLVKAQKKFRYSNFIPTRFRTQKLKREVYYPLVCYKINLLILASVQGADCNSSWFAGLGVTYVRECI